MAVANDLATLNGFFKESYADKLGNLIPDGVKLVNRIGFESRERQPGNFYHAPVTLGLEHGVTYGGDGDGAFSLGGAVAGITKDASIRGTQMVLQSVISYVAASRSVSGGKKAFEDATKHVVANMVRSLSKKLEIQMMYGGASLGVLDAGSTTTSFVIATAEWAPGIWAGAEGMKLQVRDSADVVRSSTVVTNVNLTTRTLTVSPAVTGAVATDRLWADGAFGAEFAGIHKILSNTGTLFGIDASQFNLWKANSVNAGGALSFDIIQSAVAKAVEKGLDSDVLVLVHPQAWTNLMSDLAASRQLDQSYSSAKQENGAKSIKFYGQCGGIEVEPSIYVKEGYAYVLCMDEFTRIGSTDVTFKRPGRSDDFFRDLDSMAGYELRAYSDQALFCMAPGKNCLITGIVNA